MSEADKLLNTAFHAFLSGKWDEVIETLSNECLEDHPQRAKILCDRALAYINLEFYRKAEADCLAAIKLVPDMIIAYLRLGDAYAKDGKVSKAIETWKQGALASNLDFALRQLLFQRIVNSSSDEDLLALSEPASPPPEQVEELPKKEIPKKEEPKKEEFQKVVAKKEELKKEQPKKEEPKKEPKKEEPKKEEPKKAQQKTPPPKAKTQPAKQDKKTKPMSKSTMKKERKRRLQEAEAEEAENKRTLLPGDGLLKKKPMLDLPNSLVKSIIEALNMKEQVLRQDAAGIEALLEQLPMDEKNKGTAQDLLICRYVLVGNVLVNTGRTTEAIELFTYIVDKDPKCAAGFIGRGTAFALHQNIANATEDFSSAIRLDPGNPDVYMRRGQARTAMNDPLGGVADYSAAIDILRKKCNGEKSGDEDSDGGNAVNHRDSLIQALLMRGQLFNKICNYALASKDLTDVVGANPDNADAWNSLGFAETAQGNLSDGMRCYFTVIKLGKATFETYTNLGICCSQSGKPDKSLEYYNEAIRLNPTYGEAISQKLSVYFMRGKHKEMLPIVKEAVNRVPKYASVVRYLPNVLHGLGRYRDAVQAYDTLLRLDPKDRGWYHREYALFLHHHLNTAFSDYDPDAMLHPAFKEGWSKGHAPSIPLNSGYKKQSSTFNKNISDIPLDVHATSEMSALLDAAQDVGKQMQYSASGFLSNTRHLRIAGLAAIHAAQALVAAIESGSAETALPWRNFYSLIVKWRQIYEPTDAVWWIDKLTPKSFSEGFGSCTAMIVGQSKVTRYAPMIERSLDIMRSLLVSTGAWLPGAKNTTQPYPKEKVEACKSAEDLLELIGKDFWVSTPCRSCIEPSKIYEGTRLTIQGTRPFGVDFAIRTACTPSRYGEFSKELDAAWKDLVSVASPGSDADTDKKIRTMLRVVFYWYNFMPLSRGTAAVGFISILALSMVLFNVRLMKPLPAGLQLDWEAILEENCDVFISKIRSAWLDDAINMAVSEAEAKTKSEETKEESLTVVPFAKQLPSVSSVVKTLRDAIVCLNATL